MNVRLVSVTAPTPTEGGPRTAEELMVYCARVSSPSNQGNHDSGERLLRYCMAHGHWSIFEMADMTVEIETSRAIAAQILRHRSFSFQEFSQRYAAATLGFEDVQPRRQDTKNRQASYDDLDASVRSWFQSAKSTIEETSQALYEFALAQGIAKESARFLLPLSVRTRLYMKGSVRSWIHYFRARNAERRNPCAGVQPEHEDIAAEALRIFAKAFPLTHAALQGEQP